MVAAVVTFHFQNKHSGFPKVCVVVTCVKAGIYLAWLQLCKEERRYLRLCSHVLWRGRKLLRQSREPICCILKSSAQCVPVIFTASAASGEEWMGQRLHNSVVQRGHTGQVMRVRIWGGSEFLPHQTCFGMKRKHALLPDHIVFSAASVRPERLWSALKLAGCHWLTLVVSLSSLHHI